LSLCTKSDFRWALAPAGEFTAFSQTSSWVSGAPFLWRGREREYKERQEGGRSGVKWEEDQKLQGKSRNKFIPRVSVL